MDARQLLTNPIDYPIEIRFPAPPMSTQSRRAGQSHTAEPCRQGGRHLAFHSHCREDAQRVGRCQRADRPHHRSGSRQSRGHHKYGRGELFRCGHERNHRGRIQEGNKQIPVVARLRMDERARLSDIQNLYVYSSQDNTKVPLGRSRNIDHDLVTGRIVRLEQFRTINVRSFPVAGHLSSEVLKTACRGCMQLQRIVAARLSDADWRRIRQDQERIQEPGDGDG